MRNDNLGSFARNPTVNTRVRFDDLVISEIELASDINKGLIISNLYIAEVSDQRIRGILQFKSFGMSAHYKERLEAECNQDKESSMHV